jgi:hypothetical protein
MLACVEQEHERAAGGWQAEWGTITDLLRLTYAGVPAANAAFAIAQRELGDSSEDRPQPDA